MASAGLLAGLAAAGFFVAGIRSITGAGWLPAQPIKNKHTTKYIQPEYTKPDKRIN
jgi:hypothetical protein